MDLDIRRFKITSDEHIMKAGKSISGHILDIKDILKGESDNLESWSIEILKKVFQIGHTIQSRLFDE